MTMRKKFVLFIVIPLLLFCSAVYFFADRWIESALEATGEGVVGAKVEIDLLRLSLSPIAIEFSRLQVANPKDPWKNIFETGKVRFALNFGQLLRNKYIIETMEVNNIVFGTKRSTDGSLPKAPPKTEESPSVIAQATVAIAHEAQKTPIFDLDKLKKGLNIDSLVNVQNLRTVQHLDSLKEQVQEASRRWDSTLADIDKSKRRFADIQTSIKAIDLNQLKTIESITSAIANVNNAYKNVNELNETFKSRRAAITGQLDRLYTSATQTVDLARADYESVKGLARLPDLGTRGLASLLLGKEILEKVTGYLGWIEFARQTVPKYMPTPEYEKPKRFEGQDIYFPVERSYPKWWIKKILISGGQDKEQNPDYFYATGEARNITNNQRLTGFPLTIALSGTKGGKSSFTLDASFDRRPDVPVDSYRVTAAGLPVRDFPLGRADFLPSKITNAKLNASAQVSVPGNQFDSNLKVDFRNLTLVFDRPPKNDLERIAGDVLASISAFGVQLRLWNTGGPFNVAFSTDLDDQLAARTKRVIGDELARLQNQIRSRIDQRIAAKRAEFDNLFNQKKEDALVRIRSYEALLNNQLAMVNSKKKELETRVEQEKKKQTDAAKKKLEDALKGLFKKQ
jgi:uncharacterized protein (TIGR03545 family)